MLYNEPTGVSVNRVADVAAVSKKELVKGTLLDGEGGYTTYGSLYRSDTFDKKYLIPIGMVENIKLIRDVPKNTPITLDDVEVPESNILYNLREKI